MLTFMSSVKLFGFPTKSLYAMLFEKGSVDSVSVVVSDVSVVVVTVVVSEVVVSVVSVVSVVELSVGVLSSGSVLQEDKAAHKETVSNKLTAFFANPFPNKFFFI